MAYTLTLPKQSLSQGVYTVRDVSRILDLPAPKVSRWVRGLAGKDHSRVYSVGEIPKRGEGRGATVSFHALIEIFVIAQLREKGVSAKTIREGRIEIAKHFKMAHPFTFKGLLTDGAKLIAELGDNAVLEIGTHGQTAFQSVLEPFLQKLDFDRATQCASRLYPQGKKSSVVVDPRHAFGRPVIEHTNITTAAIFRLLKGGDSISDIASDYRLTEKQIQDVYEFETRMLNAA